MATSTTDTTVSVEPTGRRRRSPRRLLRSARTRMVAAFISLLAASALGSAVALREILKARAGERVERSLEQEIEEFRKLADEGRNPLTGEPFGGDVQAIFTVYFQRNVPVAGEAVFTFLDNARGQTSGSDPRAELSEAVAGLARIASSRRGDIQLANGGVRYLAVPVVIEDRRRGTFVVTHDLRKEAQEVDEASRVAAGVSLAVLLVASLLAFLFAGRVLAPVRRVTETARLISETDLTRRIEVEGDDEIAGLGRTFNAMLDRLQAAFAMQKDFVSDAGHELRTPITIIRGHLELLGDDPNERRETVELVCDELDRMSRFVDDLLLLAQAEQADFVEIADVDLDALIEELMAKASALAPRDWRLDSIGVGRLQADRQRLTQAVMQLAQNAVQHTHEGDRIALGSALEDGRARLWVSDSGPGVAAGDRDRIFDRFARGSGTRRSQGAGLGLAIVSAIAQAHAGRVELDRTRPGSGATFTITIPTEPPPAQEARST
ncbi:MAG: HAMP domain-containing histidine kinase [Actinomycetota bacterium]|nr:HAMP domain-containing histidine kinase [Actinomycetota bacterium]